MQKVHTQVLYFNCDEKFTLVSKCKGLQLLLLEGSQEVEEEVSDDPKNSLHALTRLIKYVGVKGSFHQLKP